MIYKMWFLPFQPIQKSGFDIDLKTVYKPVHVSIATLKSRDNSALSQGPGEHTDAAASLGSPHRRCSCFTRLPQIVAPRDSTLAGPNLCFLPGLHRRAKEIEAEGHQSFPTSFSLVLSPHLPLQQSLSGVAAMTYLLNPDALVTTSFGLSATFPTFRHFMLLSTVLLQH